LSGCEKALSKFYRANPKVPDLLKNFEFILEEENTDNEDDNGKTADRNDYDVLLREIDI
jgi:ABC-type proline/glycine betaine transport system substrate-binding protein